MRPLAPLLVLALPALLAQSASAAQASGELTSDAPVALLGDGKVVGKGLVVHHHAFRAGSIEGYVYGGRLLDQSVLHVVANQPDVCTREFEGRRAEGVVLSANASRPWERIDVQLQPGALARLVLHGDLRLAIGQGAASATPSKPTAYLGPNPYRTEAQQLPADGAPADLYAPAFPVSDFAAVPAGSFNTVDPYTLEVHWGDLQTTQSGTVRTHKAGVFAEQRPAVDPNQPSPPLGNPNVTCAVQATHVLAFDQEVAATSIDQSGVDRTLGFWRGDAQTPAFAQGQTPAPEGYWDRTRGADFAAALEALRLPATVVTGPEFHLSLAGTAKFQRALGAVSVGGDLREVKDKDVTIAGTLNLQPTASQEGRRLTTRVSNDVARFDVAGGGPSGFGAYAPLALGAAGGVAVLGAAAYGWPQLKYGATQLLLFPLYARLKKEDLLENPLRDDILEVVQNQPGISASDLGRRMSCGWGTLVYHLTVLERMQLLSSTREGRHKRFFVQGRINYSDKAAVGLLANPSARILLDAIQASPGLIQRDLGRQLGLSPATIAWHIDRLAEAGLVLKEQEGRVVRYYPSSKLVELTKQLAA